MKLIKTINNFFMQEVADYKRHFTQKRKHKAIRHNEIVVKDKIKEAKRLAYITGRKHWVMRDHDGAILVADRVRIMQFKAAGKLDKRVIGADLDREAIYTANPVNDSRQKRKGYEPNNENPVLKLFRYLGWM